MRTRTSSSLSRTLVFAVALGLLAGGALPALAADPEPDAVRPKGAAEKAAKPGAAASPSAKTSTVSREDCERYARALAGREKDAAALKQSGGAAPAARDASTDLVTCDAVLADSDEPCKRLDEGSADNCRRDRAKFHELRKYPSGRSFMMDDRKYQECQQNAAMAPVCTAVRKALRSGDPNDCVLNADFEAICRSSGDLDASKCATEGPQLKKLLEGQCRALVTLDESACDIPGPRHDEMAKQCRDDVAAGKAYGKGLKELAKSGTPREQQLAKAALNETDACKALAQPVVDACLQAEAAPAPAPKAAADEEGGAEPKDEPTDASPPE